MLTSWLDSHLQVPEAIQSKRVGDSPDLRADSRMGYNTSLIFTRVAPLGAARRTHR
jgi:hypothetical protein